MVLLLILTVAVFNLIRKDPNTGTFVNTSKSHASIILQGNDADSNIRFYTTASNNSTGNQRMVIDKNGNVGIGLTNPSAYGKLAVSSTGNLLFKCNKWCCLSSIL